MCFKQAEIQGNEPTKLEWMIQLSHSVMLNLFTVFSSPIRVRRGSAIGRALGLG